MKLIDNVNHLLGDDLKASIRSGGRVKITASCFSIYAFEALKAELSHIDSLQFIFTAPTFVAAEVTDRVRNHRRHIWAGGGVVLTGETPIGRRKDLVKRFQDDEQTPFFVLSVKAGGAGLNLTAASHVVHFDRWWNPVVENQATDRAFRIDQSAMFWCTNSSAAGQ
jgi:hypothetical protein